MPMHFLHPFSLSAKVCCWWWLVVAVSLSLFCEDDDVGNSKRPEIYLFLIFFLLAFNIIDIETLLKMIKMNVEEKGEKRKREK